MTTTKQADWRETARRQTKQRRGAWIGSIALGALGGVLGGVALSLEPGVARTVMSGASIAAMVGSLLWGTVIYMLVIDEQERDANLWGCYAGMVVYLGLYVLDLIAAKLSIPVPIDESGIFIATTATVLAVFLWKRFR